MANIVVGAGIFSDTTAYLSLPISGEIYKEMDRSIVDILPLILLLKSSLTTTRALGIFIHYVSSFYVIFM